MKTLNSLSGGKTSSYIAVHYQADYNVFALVTTKDKSCLFPDKKLRQKVSDKLNKDFIGTLEDDVIIYTMFDLEQYIGKEINWVSGNYFDDIIIKGDNRYLPNVTQRFCTTELKLKPIYEWWKDNVKEVVKVRIGYRANETRRAKTMLKKVNGNGNLEMKDIVGKRKTQNKWANIEWQKPEFPLIKDNIYKDQIESFWQNKDVRFAYMNNCIGCFHRNPMLLKLMSEKHPNKFEWFIKQEYDKGKKITFKNGVTYKSIKKTKLQYNLFESDFTECDSGYCGI
tara:strand:+ start:278 stop:1123 length:846 start_codon:yes stop_codon:yes gene_type:complete